MKNTVKNSGRFVLNAMIAMMSTCVITVFSAGCLSSAEKKFEMEHEVDPGTELKVRTTNGRIVVSVGQTGQVRINGVKMVRSLSGSRRLVDEINIEVEKKDGLIHVEAKHPKNSITKQYGASFNIEVPENSPVRLVTENGGIEVTGVSGRVWVESKNGAIKVVDITGDVEAGTKNGAVKIVGKLASFRVRSSNGSIEIGASDGSSLVEDSRVSTRNGSIKLFLPRDFSCELSATTKNGKIKTDFSIGESSKRSMAGKLGDGGHGLNLETRNGSIHIRKN